jgi:hypothetical protein
MVVPKIQSFEHLPTEEITFNVNRSNSHKVLKINNHNHNLVTQKEWFELLWTFDEERGKSCD